VTAGSEELMTSHSASHGSSGESHYGRLLLMILLSFISMYVLMYAMVNSFANVYMSVNQVYMAGVMAAPMGAIELALMGGMYDDKRLNRLIVAGSLVALAVFWTLIRQQTMVADTQFLRSMIPHHAGAILMCEEAPVQDPEVRALCKQIISSQQTEIDQMKAKLRALEN
jgi:hypothetical protein